LPYQISFLFIQRDEIILEKLKAHRSQVSHIKLSAGYFLCKKLPNFPEVKDG
jgi:hypothetical protein